ncbi:hypothetical protein KIN20_013162 [Parelaphostrongylus tenuis]|uniref:Uncharacterized protein n=1 Tax=Parelaphostrongylus tenuis TaxID=148309 RepID=A0AAD5MG82_PARTN|nr:hypothetical protein KIN20_013162 [Parelaphostrongylus tenuis]
MPHLESGQANEEKVYISRAINQYRFVHKVLVRDRCYGTVSHRHRRYPILLMRQRKAACRQIDKEEVDRTGPRSGGARLVSKKSKIKISVPFSLCSSNEQGLPNNNGEQRRRKPKFKRIQIMEIYQNCVQVVLKYTLDQSLAVSHALGCLYENNKDTPPVASPRAAIRDLQRVCRTQRATVSLYVGRLPQSPLLMVDEVACVALLWDCLKPNVVCPCDVNLSSAHGVVRDGEAQHE